MDDPRAILRLPYTRPPLTANELGASRGAKMREARIRREIRAVVCTHAVQMYLPRDVAHLTVELHWRPVDNRRRDADNLWPTLKPIADALTPTIPPRRRGKRILPAVVGYGMVPDDTPQWMDKPTPVIHQAVPGEPARMWVELDWITRRCEGRGAHSLKGNHVVSGRSYSADGGPNRCPGGAADGGYAGWSDEGADPGAAQGGA